MPKRLTTEEFISKAKHIHGNKYDYSLVNYIGTHKKIKIICKEHNNFIQIPSSHLQGHGCPECSSNKKLTKKIFIKKQLKYIKNYIFMMKLNIKII